jgi:hypothetical protein
MFALCFFKPTSGAYLPFGKLDNMAIHMNFPMKLLFLCKDNPTYLISAIPVCCLLEPNRTIVIIMNP